MAVEYKELRALMLDYLKNHPSGQFDIPSTIKSFYKSKGFDLKEEDLVIVQQIIHELYFEGIFILGPKIKENTMSISGQFCFPLFQLTEYGKHVLESQEYQPHDPDGYLSRLKNEIPKVDQVIICYLEEALSCYRKNLLLAAAVMIGCAAEKAMLLLIDAYGDSIRDPKHKQDYEKQTKSFMIAHKWKALWKRLEPLSPSLPIHLRDDLGTILERVFDLIRTTRNDAGHPTGKKIEKEAIHANLLLFPSYCKRVYGLITHFSSTQI